MMSFRTRIMIGALAGVLAVAGLWFVGITWLIALGAGLLAPVAFLASFFVWSADRPDDGYEQVLFDRPNTTIAASFLIGFALLGVGAGFVDLSGGPATPADHVYALRENYLAVAEDWRTEMAAEDLLTQVATLREESDRIALELEQLPEDDARAALIKANDAYAFALDSLKECGGSEERGCMDARIEAADAESALQRYADLQ